ncbi:M28 family peptidase [Pontibacter chitinilyticus]|uniref:M28 family peptidase n=1 Tax=Pontibacter chitinilyticus TaxID=2674989 RepID=UPI00321A6A25
MILLAQHALPQALQGNKQVAKALKKIEAPDLKAHIQYLADDKLQGRQPGTPGYQLAVNYVAKQFRKLGVQPAGEDNTYLQTVKLRKAITDNNATLRSKDSSTLTYGQEFIILPNPAEAQVTVEAPLVFAGYGISAPELGYDDYERLDAKGKIVLVMRGAPASFSSSLAASSKDMLTILKTAAAHGAVGVLVGSTNPGVGLPDLEHGIYSVLTPAGEVAVSGYYTSAQVKLLAMVTNEVFVQYLRQAGLELDKVTASLKSGVPASIPLPVTLSATYHSRYTDIESYNLVGKIEGADPQLQQEYVVHSAHLDHLGIGKPVNGDSIYNGAHDNASGVASLLEIAKAYTSLKQKPKRSILLLLVTGEEMGLLGSAYFNSHPTVPLHNIVADINTDMPTIIAPLLSVVPLGADHSSLAEQVQQAAGYLGLDIEADPEPEQNRFVRSDQYSFIKQGIPALHIKYGNKTADGRNNLDALVKEWRATYYHKPQDDIKGLFDFNAGKKYAQLNFLIGYLVAQQPERPTWNKGDVFSK